ncbi:hypothetical protein EES47_08735 [Streptomyces sp. ADI98-12]|uniref:Uncharacterized protein n=1 Tax=Streptomyces griseus TaxID=1911 RepID=A0A380P142_STRGR|nr:hypothetical protein [Streptomyces sp. DSM 41037]RPK90363.1 hypothetical protein EES47_08735 [Streptomyces sp. ADI98-12]SUP58044.1 Uncharacterised protein [Streptomyces griseus]
MNPRRTPSGCTVVEYAGVLLGVSRPPLPKITRAGG